MERRHPSQGRASSAFHPAKNPLPKAWRSCSASRSSRGSERSTRKVDPTPGQLETEMVPPMSSSNMREMANPSPVPPRDRELDPSAW